MPWWRSLIDAFKLILLFTGGKRCWASHSHRKGNNSEALFAWRLLLMSWINYKISAFVSPISYPSSFKQSINMTKKDRGALYIWLDQVTHFTARKDNLFDIVSILRIITITMDFYVICRIKSNCNKAENHILWLSKILDFCKITFTYGSIKCSYSQKKGI